MATIEVRDLVVRYGQVVAVDGATFSADAGEVTCLLGPNGAGKTSTVETLEGYRRPAGGTVSVLGGEPGAAVDRIGVMLQRGGVYPSLTPRRVLRLFASYYERPRPAGELLELVGLTGVADRPWRRLSGGEQQRTSLALALVGRPEVAFLDEPTAGVDPTARGVVRSVVRSLRDEGAAVVLTTHDLAEAEAVADRVVIIDRGRVVADGTLAELRSGDRITFRSRSGLDVAAMAHRLGATVTEVEPGRYRVDGGVTAGAVVSWLEGAGEAFDELRTASTLEDVFARVTGG